MKEEIWEVDDLSWSVVMKCVSGLLHLNGVVRHAHPAENIHREVQADL